MTPKDTLKNWFVTGAKPTQEQFWAWLDSYFHKEDKISLALIEGLNDVLTGKADKELVDTIYKELLSAIDNIDLTKLIDDKSDKANDKVYSIDKVKELIGSILFINDELESSKDLTYSIDKIKEFIDNKINTINFSEVIDDDEETSDDLTYSIDKIKALLQALSDKIRNEYISFIFMALKVQASSVFSNPIEWADIFPSEVKAGDIYYIWGEDGLTVMVYEYNGREWVIKYDFRYNFIVEFGEYLHSGFTCPDTIFSELNCPLGTEITAFKRDAKTNTIYAGIRVKPENYQRGLSLSGYKKIIALNPLECPIQKIDIEAKTYKETKLIDFSDYIYLESLRIISSSHEDEEVEIDSIVLANNHNLNDLTIKGENYKIGTIDIKNIAANSNTKDSSVDYYNQISVEAAVENISIVNDEEAFVDTIELEYYSSNKPNNEMKKLEMKNTSSRHIIIVNQDFTKIADMSLPHLRARNKNVSRYNIYLINVLVTDFQINEIVEWLLEADFSIVNQGYIDLEDLNWKFSEDHIEQLQDKGYTISIT